MMWNSGIFLELPASAHWHIPERRVRGSHRKASLFPQPAPSPTAVQGGGGLGGGELAQTLRPSSGNWAPDPTASRLTFRTLQNPIRPDDRLLDKIVIYLNHAFATYFPTCPKLLIHYLFL